MTRVIGEREIEIDHANWLPGVIGRQVRVLDVSADNDWTAVRVELPEHDHFGAVYATDGFIHGWPVELGPQVVDVAATLRNFQGDRLRGTSATVPIVVGPRGVIADKLTEKAMPAVIDGRHATR